MNRLIYTIKFLFAISSICLLLSTGAQAKTLFEGYYKVMSNNVHVGYIIQRYSYDKTRKRFESINLIRTNKLSGDIFQSLKAYADDNYRPLSYESNFKSGKTFKSINATFANNTMNASIAEGVNGRKKSTVQKKLKKGTFLSTFMAYLMLSKGLSENIKFNYSAIAEEEAKLQTGSAVVLGKNKYKGIPTYKIRNTFAGSTYEGYLDMQGQMLATTSTQQKISFQLVKNASQATQGQSLSTKTIQALFGNIPLGKTNSLASKK